MDGVDILRPARGVLNDPLDAACFPLLPFSNRIAFGRFSFAGCDVDLTSDPAEGVHALHGHGWREPWSVVASMRDRVRLRFEHGAGDWPWAYATEQEFTLLDNAARVSLEVTNGSDRPMPISIGFHPYFQRTPATSLSTSVAGVWLTDASSIPSAFQGQSLREGMRLSDIVYRDHCHANWSRTIAISQPERNLVVTLRASEELGFLHLYVPDGKAYFCAEPTSAMPDAFNRREPANTTGLRILQPGATIAASVEIEGKSFR